ncbi:TetR/AcrR family transcriptional regulator [Streptomyces caeruleatus]|uniref:TetR/AcrR family transcriptional regulator n=1 Tax=Streptomyces caeruleatus TaxID=661399 RepID=UPI001FC973A7|nr:TetR/AcrR family transcriptional regulator [Streptomyces caeruleatus]
MTREPSRLVPTNHVEPRCDQCERGFLPNAGGGTGHERHRPVCRHHDCYHGTTTAMIARRVGVTQPYPFRLFPDKKTIFVAALERSMEDTRLAFEAAADGTEGDERALQAMTNAYAQLISTRPETLLMQMQGYVTVAAAEARGDDLIGEAVRAGWMRIRDTVHRLLGADADKTARFLACGMLGNSLAAMGFP